MKQMIHLIRHSLTEANEKWLYCGFSDLPLSPNGELLARHKALAAAYPDGEGCRFYTSGLLRTDQTLRCCMGKCPSSAPDLRNSISVAFELCSYDDLKETQAYQEWLKNGGETVPCPGGESGEDFKRRCFMHGGAAETRRRHCRLPGGVIAAVMAHYFWTNGKAGTTGSRNRPKGIR
jgi:broad specificity phosphatase PhoE